jgi:hypothetical protein
MKYYCPDCKTEMIFAEKNPINEGCFVCDSGLFQEIPNFETPEQYEARTGEPWSDNAPVWFRLYERSGLADFVWGVCRYIAAKKCGDRDIVCAQGPKAPPDDWRPEKEKNK